MGLLSSSDSISHTTEIKGAITREQALALLHDHDFFLTQDDLYISHKPEEPKQVAALPPTVQSVGETKCYEQVDSVPGIYAKLLPGMSQTVNHYQLTATKDGIFAHMEGALDVSLERDISIKEEGGGWVMVDNVTFHASKLLMGIIKKRFEENWQRVHKVYIDKLGAQVGSQA